MITKKKKQKEDEVVWENSMFYPVENELGIGEKSIQLRGNQMYVLWVYLVPRTK